MANKTWVATDLDMGPLKISRADDIIHIEQRYVFLDEFGEALTQIVGGRFVDDIELANLPPDILAALQTINAWTKNQALIQEEMND